MQIEHCVAVKTDLCCILEHELNGYFVIQDHLRVKGRLVVSRNVHGEQSLGFEQRIGISL